MNYEIVDAAYVFAQLGSMPLVDTRPPEMFAQGHIPGAVNVGYVALREAGGDYPTRVAEAFEAAGVGPADACIVYCQSGYLAGLACDDLAARGYTALRCYAGSWEDWVTDPTRPVEM